VKRIVVQMKPVGWRGALEAQELLRNEAWERYRATRRAEKWLLAWIAFGATVVVGWMLFAPMGSM
jgi:hypothetical protein